MSLRHFQEAITSIVRNKFLSAITIISISFILLIFNVLLAVNQITHETVNTLSDKIAITLYVKSDVNRSKLDSLIKDIEQLDFVTETNFQTSAETLEAVREKYPESTAFLEEYKLENPLPATLTVHSNDIEAQKKLISLFQNEPYQSYFLINENKQQRSAISTVLTNLINLKGFTFQLVLWVIATFTIGGALLIFNVLNVTLFSRKREIQIMQFVGASHKTIRAPFIIEGVFYGLFSFMLSILTLIIVAQFIPENQANTLNVLTSLEYQTTLIIELIAICIISAVISIFTIENYLHQKTIFSD